MARRRSGRLQVSLLSRSDLFASRRAETDEVERWLGPILDSIPTAKEAAA